MLCMPSNNTGLSPTIPAIPHMLVLLQSRNGGAAVRYGSLEQPLIALGTPLDEKILDFGQVVSADRGTTLGRVAQGTYRIVECPKVIQLDDISGIGARQEIRLTAAVVAHHG